MRVIDMGKLLCGLEGSKLTSKQAIKADLTDLARSCLVLLSGL